MDIKKALNLTIEVMKENGIKWNSLPKDEQFKILMKLPEISSSIVSSIENVLGIGNGTESCPIGDIGIIETENGDVTITTF